MMAHDFRFNHLKKSNQTQKEKKEGEREVLLETTHNFPEERREVQRVGGFPLAGEITREIIQNKAQH